MNTTFAPDQPQCTEPHVGDPPYTTPPCMLLIEDHPCVAEPLRQSLSHRAGMPVKLCTTAEQAVACMRQRRDWHRIWMDLHVPGSSGMWLPRQAHQYGLASRTAILTADTHLLWQQEAHDLGFLGYIPKTADYVRFEFALDTILAGRHYFTHESSSYPKPLTLARSKRRILVLLKDGLMTKDIAQRLHLSEFTVDNHVSGLLQAFQANSRAHLVALALQQGYLTETATLDSVD